MRLLRRLIVQRLGAAALQAIEVSTVDGYQGQEKEVIIFSCVRTAAAGGIGFLNDLRRLNVALTRAQCSLWLVGHTASLNQSPVWRALLQDARARNILINWTNRERWLRDLQLSRDLPKPRIDPKANSFNWPIKEPPVQRPSPSKAPPRPTMPRLFDLPSSPKTKPIERQTQREDLPAWALPELEQLLNERLKQAAIEANPETEPRSDPKIAE